MIKRAGALFGLVIAILVIAPSVAPIQPTYATSGSMEPTIMEGDLYFVLTFATAEEGDVATFYSPRDGEYVTHRIVDRTDEGFVTRGDANPSTDQASGRPPVDRSQVLGIVLTVGGSPVAIHNAGVAVRFLRSHRLLLVGLAVAVVLLPELRELLGSGRDGRERDVVRAGHVMRPLFAGSIALCLVLLAWSMSTHDMTWVAVQGGVTGAYSLPVDQPATRQVNVHTHTPSFAAPFTTTLIETEGMTVAERVTDGSTVHLTVELPAVEATGPYRTRVHVYPYPATLPRGILEGLHGVHWMAAAVGSLLPVFVPVWLLYVLSGGDEAILRGSRNRRLRRLGGD